jgi:hypothetical protein
VAQKLITEMGHPSYSPDLAPNDFWLFPEIKSILKGQRFHGIKDIQKENVTAALKGIPQQDFQNCFQQWQHRWDKSTAAQSGYLVFWGKNID